MLSIWRVDLYMLWAPLSSGFICFQQDQKLQLHLTAREEHHKKLNEVERCYATIVCQFGIVKGVHGQLEHSGTYGLNVLQHLFFALFLARLSLRCVTELKK